MSAVQDLLKFPRLRELPESEVSVLATVVTRRELRADDFVLVEGQPSRSCFFLVRGAVEVRKSIAGTLRHLNTLSEGTMFGQIGLIDSGPRTRFVDAVTAVAWMRIPAACWPLR